MPQNNSIRKEPLITRKWNFSENNTTTTSDGILITGANSFLGVHIIKLLQNQWPGKIYLLLRGKNHNEAISKLDSAFASWNLGNFHLSEKIKIVTGEVCQPKMGLTNNNYKKLKKDTGFVLHLAMLPLYHLPYSRYQKLWLPELEQMIQFCGSDAENPKSLHYPSSYNANFFTSAKDFEYLNTNAWQSGYAGFKWVANHVLRNAFHQGLNGCIYDIPLVVGSAKEGLCPDNYSIWHILDLFLQTRTFIPYKFNIIPIDVLAEIMVCNLLSDLNGNGENFIRPALKASTNHLDFADIASGTLGLELSTREKMYKASISKRKINFLIPEHFNDLLEKVGALPPVIPTSVCPEHLPNSSLVFLSNLNQRLSLPKYEKYFTIKHA
jgi:nucleoside-diphosphate-sugar epimerase